MERMRNVLVCLMLMLAPVHGLVAGVDFGSSFFKIALVKPGSPFSIVTNVHSKRKTESVVAFEGETSERVFGTDAMNIAKRTPANVYQHLRVLLGNKPQHPYVQMLKTTQPYEISSNFSRGHATQIHHQQRQVFQPEELVAMIFQHAAQITDAYASAKVRDWVITVPSFFTQIQRIALRDAAELANIRVLTLLEENTAAALQLGIERIDTTPKKTLIYNMGALATQVTVVEYGSFVEPAGFKKNKTVGAFNVLGKAWDEHLGGSHFDMRLANHLAVEFNEKVLRPNKIMEDVRTIPRPWAKLQAQATKTKIVLSANENIPVNIQSLYKDLDFFTHISRKKLVELCDDLFSRVLVPVENVLSELNLEPKDIDEVEIIGGGVRMPLVQSKLKDLFNNERELGVHLNGDEAMALGAAFHAANVSSSFRVRKVGMTDILSFPVGVRFSDQVDSSTPKWSKRATLFNKGDKYGLKKSVALTHRNDIQAVFRYDQLSQLPNGTQSILGHFNITGIEKFVSEMKDKLTNEKGVKVTFSFLLDMSGVVSLQKAEASLTETVQEEIPLAEIEAEEAKKKNATTESSDSKDAKTEEDDKKQVKEEEKPKREKQFRTKKVVHRRTLKIARADNHEYNTDTPEASELHSKAGLSILPLTIQQKLQSTALLAGMQLEDDKRKANAEAKNQLESFIYSCREVLSSDDEIKKVSTEEQRDTLSKLLMENEDWLYEDGEHVEAAQYMKKLKAMKDDLFDLMRFRQAEMKKRPEVVAMAQQYVISIKDLMRQWETSKPQITEKEREEILARVEKEIDLWLQEKMKKQADTPLYESPVFVVADVQRRVNSIKQAVKILRRRPKPIVKPETNSTATNSTDADDSKNATTTEEKEKGKSEGAEKKEEEVKKEENKESGEKTQEKEEL